jgi:hypothetical protein
MMSLAARRLQESIRGPGGELRSPCDWAPISTVRMRALKKATVLDYSIWLNSGKPVAFVIANITTKASRFPT